ncbi:MAG: chlorite dismutase family protein [Actinomycetota bacterium]
MTFRKFMRYAFYRLDPAWRAVAPEDRALHKKELIDLLTEGLPEGIEVHPYSVVGLRADTDLLLWEVAESPLPIQELQSRLNATALGRALIPSHSYLAMARPSKYLKGHQHAGQEVDLPPGPVGSTYLFVYPMVKVRPWYRLPFEERRRMMGEHFRIGHKYPGIKIHTGYSFGLDDQEFVVAFEGESPAEFLDLVMELRESEVSSYTEREVPIFTCARRPLPEILDQL